MNPLIRALHGSRQYIIAFTIYLLIAFLYCSLHSKAVCFINLNGSHTPSLEAFFTWYTMLGEGYVAILLCIVLFIRRHYLLSVHLLVAFLISGMAAQIIKEFMHMPRPKVFLHAGQYNQFIEGVTRGGWSSFPSGHTVTAFAVATILALHTRNKWASLLYLILAVGVGYSRIYLGQHFLEDVLAGSIVGVFFAGWVCLSIPELKLFGRRIAREQAMTPVPVQ
ncbi:PAP2 family protein [Paraflavitalea soli]|uniref:PAP2 family protein n=1 Tax=Paraflavitalea soli TaxID=2315862 RepID=A0A3B7MT37_9BACT|nr:phosphatase PAP2 family protein [Paraflavitalea soli]AXY77288.1 PAP2 family protein [Paraflavitalea soli]